MNISQGFVKTLITLRDNNQITGGQFNKFSNLLEPMLSNGGIKRKQLSRSRFEIVLVNSSSFNLYIKTKFNIVDLDGYLFNLQNPMATRGEMLTVSLDDKAKSINPFDGMYISSYDNIEISIDGQITKLNNLNGSAMFISKSCRLEISKEILVVGIENTENLLFILQQIEYFSNMKQKKVFIYRNKFMLHWLEKIENNYLHYGDFDFAGISIYKSEILPRVKANKRFFIPSNIEDLLNKGQSDLYYQHYSYKANIMGIDDDLDKLITLIDDYKKTVRQEFLICHKKGINE
ncbi:MAG: Unknown protein [uncultured Sulfurovum sp.]|uniref:DUF7281 domain-containing protein n=1 Tax=uncultured Sulfurovum sp. TaxID=269237 RepID=A0A6S6S3A6_9BACT|nr:MAG: Unknown protein [uncultured Sulfurovum sp.]